MTSSRNPVRTALFSATLLVIMPSALADSRDGEVPAQAEVIAAIQARLSELGYYRGRPDGIVGQMTREAIRRYERQLGVEPTGTPSLAIYRRLRAPAPGATAGEAATGEAAGGEPATDGGSTEAPEVRQIAATAAALPLAPRAGGAAGPAAEPPSPARAPERSGAAQSPEAGIETGTETGRAAEAVTVAGASWRFADESGAAFTLQLRPDGAIGGVPFGDSWTWKQDGDSVELHYANRLGRTVARRGTLVTADSIAGTATSSAGGRWTWTAERLP